VPRTAGTHVADPKATGERLREARRRSGLSQRELAFPGCTAAYISRIEAGDRIASLQVLRELGRRLGVSADYLASGSEPEDATSALRDSELAIRLEDPSVAKEQLNLTLESSDEPPSRARALAGLGQLAFEAGNHEAAIERFQEAMATWPPLENEDPSVADSLGRSLAHTSRYEEAISVFERHLAVAEERDDLIETIRFSVLLANTLTDRGRFGHAEELLGHALALAERSNDPLTKAQLWWAQSRLHAMQKDSDRAERYASLALSTLVLTDHLRYSALAHHLLAYIKLDNGEPEEALELLERGFPLIVEGGNAYEQGLFHVEQARAFEQLGRLDEAQAQAQRGIELLADASPSDAARAMVVLGDIHERQGRSEEAISAYESAVERLPVAHRYKLEVCAKLAELLRKVGRQEQALDVLSQALALGLEATKQEEPTAP
jgi:tetratricopeptide (TPR) repeat protein